MKIAVIGAGGVGGYFGGRLARAGFDVTFIARGEHLKALQVNGLQVNSINGDFHIQVVHATDDVRAVKDAGLVILGVKAWHVAETGRLLRDIIHPDAAVLPLQNGIMATEELMAVLEPGQVLSGLCRIISKIEAPGVIAHLGVDPVIIFGEPDNRTRERTRQILDLFEKAGVNAWIAKDIQAELWKKFINICVGGLLTITRSTYGEMRELKETREMMIALLDEIYLLSQQMHIQIDRDFVSKTVGFIDSFPYNSTCSLTRDIWNGKPSEIEYQNGTVVKLASRLGLDVPVNRFVYHCILPMEQRARKVHHRI
jgi:2-dehydropantoate 2-reductase